MPQACPMSPPAGLTSPGMYLYQSCLVRVLWGPLFRVEGCDYFAPAPSRHRAVAGPNQTRSYSSRARSQRPTPFGRMSDSEEAGPALPRGLDRLALP